VQNVHNGAEGVGVLDHKDRGLMSDCRAEKSWGDAAAAQQLVGEQAGPKEPPIAQALVEQFLVAEALRGRRASG
jgi:hypothetical protein